MNTERSGLSQWEVDDTRTAGGERFAVDNPNMNNCKSRGGLRP